ncbi:nucleotidyl transferase AbiEii/AbiGii toxin family protein [Chelatococcus asaccharovorans]|uniref:ParB-like nuclease family protein n=1 Tax=Chelatococcus asaccharovorans TaxID=28210 RepID=A0A2V3UIJ1_9HYPH|nr:nucleotidyl transferase AbiEii/AbiGii toxin family protein [Chelatococcus asaccharovorans]PXW64647.1 ParB-like nuclease family protein [Chelatococcus asaccharovorans]
MATAIQKITLSSSRDIPFNKLVLSQANVRRVKSGVSIEELAESIARLGLIQSLQVRPVVDAEGAETGMFEVPAGGRRYRALELLVKQKRLNKTALVPCVVSDANRAIDVLCYEPGYTLVEKLQTLSTKFRQQQASGEMPVNFMRHDYDVSCLLEDEGVRAFIGTPEYRAHKADRFRGGDEPNLRRNEAFRLSDPATRQIYADAYERTRALYYRDRPSLDAILAQLDANLDGL